MPKTKDHDAFLKSIKPGYTPHLFKERIRQLRADRGVSQVEMGKLIGVSSQAIQIWEYGHNQPSMERMVVLASILQVDAGWLAFGLDMSDVAKAAAKRKGKAESVETEKSVLGRQVLVGVRIPLLEPDDPELVPKSKSEPSRRHIFTHYPCSQRAFGLVVKDTRNAPKFRVGDVVVVDREVKPKPGAMVLARDGDEIMLGKLRYRNDEAELLALSDDWPTIKPSEKNLIGTIVEYSSSFCA